MDRRLNNLSGHSSRQSGLLIERSDAPRQTRTRRRTHDPSGGLSKTNFRSRPKDVQTPELGSPKAVVRTVEFPLVANPESITVHASYVAGGWRWPRAVVE
jgi:hypothetical protein